MPASKISLVKVVAGMVECPVMVNVRPWAMQLGNDVAIRHMDMRRTGFYEQWLELHMSFDIDTRLTRA